MMWMIRLLGEMPIPDHLIVETGTDGERSTSAVYSMAMLVSDGAA